ncbi:hypothetical protein OG417_25160 [Actinoallomurus sp. NBC_01490]|uniref:hypothetical protein n=1 Tax=Actinoallomurus sp. NBC_01490 TaxID=2903557 RepID=UPI002E329265|nr:hypothetical protein [Actinoallomurus sp. NBC_01490]
MSNETKPFVVLITMDRETSSIVFTRSDGKEARFPLHASPFTDTSALSSLSYTPSFDALLAVTRAGDDIAFELPKQGGGDQLADRLVVYLDQNQWSALANALHDTGGVTDEDRDAALHLTEWVRQGKVILPASAGHYYETAKWSKTDKRYRLGLTILQLSRGWQMRDPLQVRRDELHAALRRQVTGMAGTPIPAVFTLAPNVLHSARERTTDISPPGFQPAAAFQHEALTSATALIDVMLDSERLEPGPDIGWTEATQRFSDWLDSEDIDSRQKRKHIDASLLSDFQTEIVDEARAAGISSEQLHHWKEKQAIEDIRSLPATGLFCEILRDRHLNKGIIWKRNDLIDTVYLSCAAGYASFVVCEGQMASFSKQGIRRLKRSTQVFRKIRDAVPVIEEALAASRNRSAGLEA